jgi:peptide-methionine (S)-S-oxide reductase
VIRTRVGYAGGTTSNPTYYNIGDHSETIQIDYDPAVISYEELLNIFWKSHDPTYNPGIFQSFSRQYLSIIFYHGEEQERLAMESKQHEETKRGEKIYTDIMPLSRFYLAEDYHQKYYLRQSSDLLKEFSRIYPDTNSLINSTAVTRINGYLGGNGTFEELQKQLNSLGLSSSGEKRLLEIGKATLSSGNDSATCPLPN